MKNIYKKYVQRYKHENDFYPISISSHIIHEIIKNNVLKHYKHDMHTF
jgi:hypothetical protein